MAVIQLKHWSESDQEAIRQQLDRILKSGPFHQSHRRQRFLEYLVNETLAGRSERLKGYNVALEVFDRPETFDPIVDPSCGSRPRVCVRSFASTTTPTAKAIPFESIYRRERTPRKSSFGRRHHLILARSTGRDNPRSTPGSLTGACCIPVPFSQDALRIPSGLHNCSFACAACRFQRMEVVGSIHSII